MLLYRWLTILAHRFNLHHMPPFEMENGVVVYWCQWCGLRIVNEPPNTASSATAPGASDSDGDCTTPARRLMPTG